MTNKPISVLVVDDEPVLRELVAFILIDKGFHVREAESGQVAFQMICKDDFDVVVSDVRMPNGSGVELLTKIGRMNEPKPTVFLVSGYSELSLDEARRLGARDLLNKPVDFEKLCQAIIHSKHAECSP